MCNRAVISELLFSAVFCLNIRTHADVRNVDSSNHRLIANEEGTVRSRKYRSKAKGESNVNGSVKSIISKNPKNTKTRRKPKNTKKTAGTPTISREGDSIEVAK